MSLKLLIEANRIKQQKKQVVRGWMKNYVNFRYSKLFLHIMRSNIHSNYISAFFYMSLNFGYDRSSGSPIATILKWLV